MNVRISPEWLDKLIAAGFPKEDLCLGVAEEILRRLPHIVPVLDGSSTFALRCYPSHPDRWCVDYEHHYTQWEDTLANAAAAMWCYLKENNLLPTPDEA